ncbi:Wadjet anti-phage system protein JetD domain-containing protein [Xanthomonas medicagonis]|uniref:Wadjet anti-phage system protein JetD domain-containing protein n=1 Tax=Xanthomonas medicagonis TaxID=3160841 RepID=UPI0035157AEF
MARATAMLLPDAALAALRAQWRLHRGAWLLGEAAPQPVALRMPTQAQASAGFEAFGAWLRAWRDTALPGQVQMREVKWPQLGPQRLPCAWQVGADEAALALGEQPRWQRARQRCAVLLARWPQAAGLAARLHRQFDLLADAPESEFQRLLAVVDWLHAHPHSGLFLRQLPIAGIDSKWIEPRRGVVADWLAGLRGIAEPRGFDSLSGLRRAPDRVRLRLLDPELRARLGGLEDLQAPIAQIAALRLPVRQVLIVENRETGLACADLPGTLLLMARGYAVDYVRAIDWLQEVPLYYWGDIDTHGLAILHRLRRHAPRTVALLMDAAALRATPSDLWGHERRQHRAQRLEALTAAEQALYTDLRSGRFGPAPRLEQERIAWDYAWPRIRAALAG